VVGAAVAVAGAASAGAVLQWMLEASGGRLNIDSHLQARLVTWEITALALLAGGALAGATKMNPVKQGLCVGLGATSVLLGMRLSADRFSLEELIMIAGNTVALGLVGGWFGGQMFPPVLGARPRGLGPASL
jgi:hypothetical protein